MPTNARRGAGLVLVSAAGFGVAAVFAKEAYRAGVTVSSMLAVRFAIAAAVFWALAWYRRSAWPGRRAVLGCVALGGVGYAVQAALYFGALARIEASLAALLLYSYPALVTVLAVLLRRERPDVRRLVALACSAAGVLLLLGTGGGFGSGGIGGDRTVAVAGVVLALGAAAAYAVYLTAAHGLIRDVDLILLSAIVFTSAAGTLTVASAATGSLHLPARPVGWLWIALLAIVSTVVPVACVFAGVRAVGAPTAAILSCAEPAVTVALTAAVYGERLTAGQLAGGAAVVAAVAVLQFRRRARTSQVERGLLDQGGRALLPAVHVDEAQGVLAGDRLLDHEPDVGVGHDVRRVEGLVG